MRIIGNLQLFEGHATGSVVVKNVSTKAVITSMQTNDEGWFEFMDLPENTELKFYGFSGQDISAGAAESAISDESKVNYIGYFQPSMEAGLGIYLNAASTLIALHLEAQSTPDYETVATKVKTFLFDDENGFLTGGYTGDFYAMIAPSSVFDHRIFAYNAVNHGSIIIYAKSLMSNEMNVSDKKLLFANVFAEELSVDSSKSKEKVALSSSAPAIPSNPDWAMNQSSWANVINLQTNPLGTNMQRMQNMTDAIAYAAGNSSSIADGTTSYTLNDFGKMAAGKIGGAAASYAASYGFSMLSDWIFNKKSSGQKLEDIKKCLSQVSSEINTIITELAALKNAIKGIYSILSSNELNRIEEEIIQFSSKIKRATQHVYNATQTTTGMSASDIKSLRDKISNHYDVVTSALTICQYINPTVGTSLPSALSTSLLNKHPNLMSNENFYGTIQMIHTYYAKLVTQAIMLSVQAHNSKENKGVTNGSTVLKTSSHVSLLYNEYLLGAGSTSYLQEIETLFRSTFTPYSDNFLSYLGTTLPLGMAVGLTPQQAAQPTTLFYNNATDIFIFGYVGYRFANWTASVGAPGDPNNVYAINGKSTIEEFIGPVPAGTQWRYPSVAEFNALVANRANPSKFASLLDQGMGFDPAINPNLLEGVWTNETISSMTNLPLGGRYQGNALWNEPNTLVPLDSNYQDIPCDWWRHNKWPFGHGPYHLQMGGAIFGKALNTDGTAFANSSKNASQLPGGVAAIQSWTSNTYFANVYGFVVASVS